MRCITSSAVRFTYLFLFSLLLCVGFLTFSKANSPKGEKTIHIELFLEGLFDFDASNMRPAHCFVDNIPKPVFEEGIADEIVVSLHEVLDYEEFTWGDEVVFQQTTPITYDGNAWLSLPETINGEPFIGTYWLAVTHRNHLETVYHDPITLELEGVYHCNFIQGGENENNALGNNQTYLGEIFRNNIAIHAWAIYAGDINGDGFIDLVDRYLLRVSMAKGIRGYVCEDLNGDGLVTISDRSAFKRNFFSGVNAVLPQHIREDDAQMLGF